MKNLKLIIKENTIIKEKRMKILSNLFDML